MITNARSCTVCILRQYSCRDSMIILICILIAGGWLLQLELEPRRLGAVSVKPRHLISDLVISDLVSLDTASMWS